MDDNGGEGSSNLGSAAYKMAGRSVFVQKSLTRCVAAPKSAASMMTGAPMNDSIKGGMTKKFTWTKAVDESFEKLNKGVATQPILVLHSFEKPSVVECDANNIAIGSFLSQEGRPIAFFSERLNKAKTRYSTYDLELYALVQVLKK